MVSMALSGGARAVARCGILGVPPFSDTAEGLYRGYLTPAHRATVLQVGQWMRDAGMDVRIDPAGNLIGRYEGGDPRSAALIVGSHIDSVRDAGRYDGPLGIMLGIECVAALHAEGSRPSFPIEIYAFGDEEGSRFPAAMLTSRAVAGTLDLDLSPIVDEQQISLLDALDLFRRDCGVEAGDYEAASRKPGTTLAYLEAHIEQGPMLEAAGNAIGTVTGIAAQLRYQVEVTGLAGHAGTTAMALRRDALAGAAEMTVAIERIARGDGSDLVATVGKIETFPGAANVIPGRAVFTVDIRSGVAARRDRAAALIKGELTSIAAARKLDLHVICLQDLPASACDPELMDMLDAAILEIGEPVHRLVSGAGHDAMIMAALCPTAMLFIRCRHGISHNPAEHVDPADADAALKVMLGFIDRLGAAHVDA